ncbi:MAG: hypothetical protein GC189_05115 [Alphaproteobacteria bacterium]|nr:hypothetical protein [Alphaproteobacteria bacterium]
MTVILLAHAPGARGRAALIAKALAAAGFEVRDAVLGAASPRGRASAAQTVASADRVLVLWSNDARHAPGLGALARRAVAAGKLSVARLDASSLPLRGRQAPVDLSRWTGRQTWQPWRALLAQLSGAAGPTPPPEPQIDDAAPVAAPTPPSAQGLRFVLATILVGALAYALAWSYLTVTQT